MNFDEFKEKIKKHKAIIILIAIVISAFIYQILILNMYPYLYGVDGAYYNLQVINILETGEMWAGDNPFSFYYFAFITLIIKLFMPITTPLEVVTTIAIKIGIVIFTSCISVPTYFIIKKYSKNEISALFGAFISTFNPLLFRLLGDFVKNAIGTFFLLLFIYLFILCCENKYEIKKTLTLYFLTYGIFVITALTHIYPTGFAACFVFIYLIYSIIHKLATERKLPLNEFKIIGFLVLTVSFTILVMFLLLPDLFDHFFKIESFIEQLFDITLQTEGAVFKILQKPIGFPSIHPISLLIMMIISVIGLIIIIFDLKNQKKLKPIFQYLAFNLILFLPVYLITPNLSSLPAAHIAPQNIFINALIFLTNFPVTAGLSLLVFEIYKNDPNKFKINRLKGIILAIFLLSMILALLIFLPEFRQWQERFAYMNFIPIALLIGYGIKALKNEKKTRVIAVILIMFFSISFIIQTQYFNYYQSKPIITPIDQRSLVELKLYIGNNASLSGSVVLTNNLGLYYFTALYSDQTSVLVTNPNLNRTIADEYAESYNETIFIVEFKMGPPPDPAFKVIIDYPASQIRILLANDSFNFP
ncbi:MAG: hypothetical protein EAX96_10175 [Candidatus Lokiarchaeota archaeon]|nr:hypothetical protein [Candidatus Lokiarchaeota archaeon]